MKPNEKIFTEKSLLEFMKEYSSLRDTFIDAFNAFNLFLEEDGKYDVQTKVERMLKDCPNNLKLIGIDIKKRNGNYKKTELDTITVILNNGYLDYYLKYINSKNGAKLIVSIKFANKEAS